MTDQEIMTKLLFEKFGKLVLDTDETASITGIKKKTLETDRTNAVGIPFIKRKGQRGQVTYSITTIAKHLINNQIKTI